MTRSSWYLHPPASLSAARIMGKKDVYMDWIVAADAIEIIAFVAILSKIQFSHQGEILCILLRFDESGMC